MPPHKYAGSLPRELSALNVNNAIIEKPDLLHFVGFKARVIISI
jgi:hypothetical protein